MFGIKRDERVAKQQQREALELLCDLELISKDELEESKGPLSGHVLIVDQSESMRREMKFFVQRFGASCDLACNGEEALAVLKSGRPYAAVFSELHMPKMSGLNLLQEMTKDLNLAKIPFIMVTSETAVAQITQAKSLGAQGWLLKPTSIDAVGTVLKKVCKVKKG